MTKDEIKRIALECSASIFQSTFDFAEKIMAAERKRQRDKINAHIGRTTMSIYGTQLECKAARDALERLLDDEVQE